MLKKIVGAFAAALLFVSMLPATGLAVARYEILQIGDEDAWVLELQEKLCELGYLKATPTGYFGTNTQNAVLAYQRDNGLSADGKAGPITRQSILGDEYRPITGPRDEAPTEDPVQSAEPSAEPTEDATSSPEPEDPPVATGEPNPEPSSGQNDEDEPTESPSDRPDDPDPDSGSSAEPTDSPDVNDGSSGAEKPDTSDTLQLGDKGDVISALQRRLKELEYYDYSQITGYYGPVTEEAVLKFERTNGLDQDGIMSPEDLTILNSEDVEYYMMFPGDQGDDVYAMQERLIKLGYLEPDATGYYGTATTLAVKLFQETNDLMPDGTAGKETRECLYSNKAVAYGEIKPDNSDGNEMLSSNVAKLISVAESQAGKRYVYGASGPNAFDCSGFVYYCLKGAGVSVSRMSSAGFATVGSWETIKSKSNLQIGDLVFFKSDSSSSISHVGIYAGGGNFIHAAPSIGGVGTSTMSSGYYSRNFVTAKRVF